MDGLVIMKRMNNLYYKICDTDTIINMYDNEIKVNVRNKLKIEKFNNYYSINISKIKNILCGKNYIPGRYNIFLIREPKYRIIMSQNIIDKVINHLVSKYFLINVFDKKLIKENTATRVGKGTHYALRLFKKYYNDYKIKYDKFYILKFDINKYFYNIDHEVVKNIIERHIKDKNVLNIINNIIDSTDDNYVNENINILKKKEIIKLKNSNLNNMDKNKRINEINNIPLYEKGKGFPIGNMSSQIVATFYLNELDHFIKNELKIKGYIRYMDDGILFYENRYYLEYCLDKLKKLLDKYKLKLNKKTRIYCSNEEMEFLGFRFINKNKIIMKVSNKTKKRFKKKIRKKYDCFNKYRSVRDSYIGHLKYGCCGNLVWKYLFH